MKPFFVIGLPRSRTAWLSLFLTDDKRICYHEGIDGCNSICQYINKIGSNGDSSTFLMNLDINKLFPDSPVLIIENDINRTITYTEETYGYYVPMQIYELRYKMDKIKGMRIYINEIDDKLELIWKYLRGDKFNKKRAELFSRMNIQVQNPYKYNKESLKQLMSELNNG